MPDGCTATLDPFISNEAWEIAFGIPRGRMLWKSRQTFDIGDGDMRHLVGQPVRELVNGDVELQVCGCPGISSIIARPVQDVFNLDPTDNTGNVIMMETSPTVACLDAVLPQFLDVSIPCSFAAFGQTFILCADQVGDFHNHDRPRVVWEFSHCLHGRNAAIYEARGTSGLLNGAQLIIVREQPFGETFSGYVFIARTEDLPWDGGQWGIISPEGWPNVEPVFEVPTDDVLNFLSGGFSESVQLVSWSGSRSNFSTMTIHGAASGATVLPFDGSLPQTVIRYTIPSQCNNPAC